MNRVFSAIVFVAIISIVVSDDDRHDERDGDRDRVSK